MLTETVTLQSVKQSKTKIFIKSGTYFRRIDKDESKFLFTNLTTPAIHIMQGEYLFAYENHIWSVQQHEAQRIK